MAISVSRLRRGLVVVGVLVCVVVLGAYFYARHRVQNALKQFPSTLGLEIQQSANGFSISKSDHGRTLFRLQASKAVQFKQGGRIELRDVMITLYGRDSSRFDQVYGQQFEYDLQSGNVTSKGEVSIDLQANPQGILNPDQAAPKELKNPIHLKTSDLVFNKNSGDASTPAAIEFSVPQASGSAVGVKYVAKDAELTLQSQVKIVVGGPSPSTILAERAILSKGPREIVLKHPHAESPDRQAQADELTLYLSEDNTLDHAIANGNVDIQSSGSDAGKDASHGAALRSERRVGAIDATRSRVSAEKLEVLMKSRNAIQTATLSGNVRLRSEGAQVVESTAGRAGLTFGARNTVTKIHADERVKLVQTRASENSGLSLGEGRGRSSLHNNVADPQDVEITAPAMDFFVAGGRRLTRVETVGSPQISLIAAEGSAAQTRVTADKFVAKFDSAGQLASVHGEANARVVTTAPPKNGVPQPDRISSSESIDAVFYSSGGHPNTGHSSGIDALVQQGQFTYSAGEQRAFADRARYTPKDQILVLSGSPRIVDGGMATTARSVRLNRGTSEGFAEGDVKTTYSDLKPQAGGALLASSDPVHVTAQNMVARGSPAIATYSGGARLWQNANVVEAPSIQFQSDQRTVVAESKGEQKVSTVLQGPGNGGKGGAVSIKAEHLSYRDDERKIRFEGSVIVRSVDLTISSKVMDVLLASAVASANSAGGAPTAPKAKGTEEMTGPAKLEKIVASGGVLITQPNRRGSGEKLVYTTAEDKFVLSGGSPSIFDAERGKITGVSLTLFRRDDRVVVEGDSGSPAVTRTQVVR